MIVNKNRNDIRITKALVDKVGTIDRVLAEFFDKQTHQILLELQLKFPETPENALNQVLNKLATLEGTKQPLKRADLNHLTLNKEQIDFCLSQLENARILRFEEDTYELAHDTLALHISEKRSADEVALLEITQLVKDRFSNYKNTKTLLSQRELQWLENYKTKLIVAQKLKKEEWAYIRESGKDISRKRRLKIFIIGSVITVLVAASLVANYERMIARTASKKAKVALDNLQVQLRTTAIASYDKHMANGIARFQNVAYQAAISEYEKAVDIAKSYPNVTWKGPNPLKQITISKELIISKGTFNYFLTQGDSLFLQGVDKYVDAIKYYEKALELSYNNVVAQNRINKVKGMLPGVFEDFKRNGEIFFDAEAYAFAKEQFEQATRIKPENVNIRAKLKACQLKLQQQNPQK